MGAVGLSILGSMGGKTWLFVGAIVGGAFASAGSVFVASKLRLIAPSQVRATAIGALLGFTVAAPLAASNLHSPVFPVLATGLTGLGALIGSMRK